jgi:uncharacterized surface protein with fasciclin (FAS1) repeats
MHFPLIKVKNNNLIFTLDKLNTCNRKLRQQKATFNQNRYIMNIIETAVSNGSFKTLVAAKVADLEDALTLKALSPCLPQRTMHLANYLMGSNALIKPENKEDLTSILTYHVLVGKIMSTDLSDGESHNGERRRSNGSFKRRKVFINDAEVVLADVETDNGVIHAIR